MEQMEIAWTAPEFEYRHKDVGWYWTTMITAILMIGAAVYMKNFLFAIFIVLAEILLIIWGNRQPVQIPLMLTEKEFTIGLNHKKYEMKDLAKFSVDENSWSDWQHIHLYFHNNFRTALNVLVPTNRLAEIREAFGRMLEEVPHEDNMLDVLERFLGF